MAETALRVEQLSLAFGGLRVLDRVSFEVRPGELLALIGPTAPARPAS
jgi:branched-chain amino acid transport system ATP-binding protein